MTNENMPPDWAIEKALYEAGNAAYMTVADVKEAIAYLRSRAILALARRIAKTDEPPKTKGELFADAIKQRLGDVDAVHKHAVSVTVDVAADMIDEGWEPEQ